LSQETAGPDAAGPQLWTFRFTGRKPLVYDPYHLHAVVSRWLDPSGGHHGHQKPWKIDWPEAVPDGLRVRIGLLDPRLSDVLVSAVTTATRLRLGSWHARVAQAPVLSAQSTWAALAGSASHTRWRFEFLSPVTFHSGSRFHPLPQPVQMLEGLLAAWNRWSPLLLTASFAAADVPVEDLNLRSEAATFRRGGRDRSRPITVSGSVGSLTIRVTEPSLRSAVATLANWSRFAGIGAWTERGFGTCRAVPEDRQR
jgi:CRISPR-associated endoribonuclease Cas6